MTEDDASMMRAPLSPAAAHWVAPVADALPWPLLVLQVDGRLRHANRAARDLLARRRPLQLSASGHVRADAAQPALEQALQEAAAGRVRMLHWPAPADAADRSGHSATLTALAAMAQRPPLVLMALGITTPRRAEVQAYAQLHGLTSAEARVLHRLARGDNSSAAAAALGITSATVRSQIVNLRRKTGHASLCELVLALATLPPLAEASDASANDDS